MPMSVILNNLALISEYIGHSQQFILQCSSSSIVFPQGEGCLSLTPTQIQPRANPEPTRPNPSQPRSNPEPEPDPNPGNTNNPHDGSRTISWSDPPTSCRERASCLSHASACTACPPLPAKEQESQRHCMGSWFDFIHDSVEWSFTRMGNNEFTQHASYAFWNCDFGV
jgi:hypothetical protein